MANYVVKWPYVHLHSSFGRPHSFEANLLVKAGGFLNIRKPNKEGRAFGVLLISLCYTVTDKVKMS